jgi:RNA polymerase sigma-70 factor (ECF subfamily)
MTDQQALHEYAVSQDAEAFRILVEHYQRLVYSAASRRLARVEDIEDVVQLTFLKLAKAAGAIRRDLSSWLYTTTINTANDLIRRDQTRRRHEALAATAESFSNDAEREDWNQLSFLIDEVLLELPASGQSLIVEHFLRGRSQRDLAEQMNVSQPTVLRRIAAAVDDLRQRLADRGYNVAAPFLALTLEKIPQPSIPPAVTSELAKVGLSGMSAGSAGVSGLSVAWIKIGLGPLVLAALIVGTIRLLPRTPTPTPPSPAPPLQAAALSSNPADWRTAFNNAYALQPNQNLKFIPPPPLPERQKYFHEVEQNDTPMPFIQWRWINGHLKREWMQGSGPDGASFASVLATCAKLDGRHISLVGLPPINADGDWIVRDGAPTEAILADLHTILIEHFKTEIRFEKIEVVKDALIVTGKYHLQRIRGATIGDLQIYSDVLDHPKEGESIQGGGNTSPAELWTMMGGYLNIPIVDEARNEPREIDWLLSRSILRGDTKAGRQQILDNITKQTGVTFKQEKRTFTTWNFTAAPTTQPAQPPTGL